LSSAHTPSHNALPDYFAQDQYKELDPNARMLDDLSGAAPLVNKRSMRTLLDASCSGMRKCSRDWRAVGGSESVCAARMCCAVEFLLLGRTENHLDMRAKTCCSNRWGYTGTVVFVCTIAIHRQPGDAGFEIEEGSACVRNYEDYLCGRAAEHRGCAEA